MQEHDPDCPNAALGVGGMPPCADELGAAGVLREGQLLH
jgi:hypothetical protein